MKHYALSLAYALTLVSFGPPAASAAEQLFSLTVAAPKEPLKQGRPSTCLSPSRIPRIATLAS
jgi:hypothetical protein